MIVSRVPSSGAFALVAAAPRRPPAGRPGPGAPAVGVESLSCPCPCSSRRASGRASRPCRPSLQPSPPPWPCAARRPRACARRRARCLLLLAGPPSLPHARASGARALTRSFAGSPPASPCLRSAAAAGPGGQLLGFFLLAPEPLRLRSCACAPRRAPRRLLAAPRARRRLERPPRRREEATETSCRRIAGRGLGNACRRVGGGSFG